jgi:cyclopropane fatty-acyl-phospholipid synthase-like methyltransferase
MALDSVVISIVSNEIMYKLKQNNVHTNDYLFYFMYNRFGMEEALNNYTIDGKDSANKLKEICKELNFSAPVSLLEFGSGYGRVTRHIDKTYFDVTCSDIHERALDFCSKKFKCKTILSASKPGDFKSENAYDVVFALSFFSHMPDKSFGEWIRVLYNAVKSGGALVFTTHGLVTRDKVFEGVTIENGYYFSANSEQGDLPCSDYGTTIVEYSWVCKTCQQYISVLPSAWKEGFWWGHQDLYIIRK